MDEESPDSREPSAEPKRFPCGSCGAKLDFQPGTESQTCSYCGHVNPIPQSEDDIEELDFREYLDRLASERGSEEKEIVSCDTCGALQDPLPTVTAYQCPYCDSNIVTEGERRRLIKPESLLPFEVTRERARGSFERWLGGLWFAPSRLKGYARRESKLSGMYMPYWTYDSSTTSFYTGQRGEDYWVTETYTANKPGGGTETRTRQVRKTRWYPAQGTVWNDFNDVLVAASRSLPTKMVEKLEPWDLAALVPYADEYLSGFRAESYTVDLARGFETAKTIMDAGIRQSVRRDIGGDHQQIHSVKTRHDGVTFKHVLLPLWVSAYRFREKVYRFVVNARTGEVQGERPYSFWKIFGAVLAGVLLIVVIVLIAKSS